MRLIMMMTTTHNDNRELVIAPIKVLDKTKRAYFVRWFSMDKNEHVCAWIPMRFVRISNMTMYISKNIYDNLELKKFVFRRPK